MTGRYGTQDAAVLAENEELKAKLARYESAVTRLLALFGKPDARGVLFAATTTATLDRIIADMGTGSPEADAGGTAESGTADGMPAPDPVPGSPRMAVDGDGKVKPVSEFSAGEKWWCDGEECGEEDASPHVHCMMHRHPVDLLTGKAADSDDCADEP